jgi:rhodanese-related sulfurtransferase
VLGIAAAILLGAAQPAAPPDYPTAFIRVDELKADLDRGAKIDIIDVRGWDQYADMHIKNARSMPMRSIEARAPKEITRTGRVVFY